MGARRIGAGLGLVLALTMAGPGPRDGRTPRRFEFTEPHMGTAFTIVLYTDDEATARRASRAAFDRVAELDRTLTDYDPESELMRLCARAGGLRWRSDPTSSRSSTDRRPSTGDPGAPST